MYELDSSMLAVLTQEKIIPYTLSLYCTLENQFKSNNCTRDNLGDFMSRRIVHWKGRPNIQWEAQKYWLQHSTQWIWGDESNITHNKKPATLNLEQCCACLVSWFLEKLKRYWRRAVLLCHELVLIQTKKDSV